MKKRLFGALLVPILALGMLFTSCGGGDNGVTHDVQLFASRFVEVNPGSVSWALELSFSRPIALRDSEVRLEGTRVSIVYVYNAEGERVPTELVEIVNIPLVGIVHDNVLGPAYRLSLHQNVEAIPEPLDETGGGHGLRYGWLQFLVTISDVPGYNISYAVRSRNPTARTHNAPSDWVAFFRPQSEGGGGLRGTWIGATGTEPDPDYFVFTAPPVTSPVKYDLINDYLPSANRDIVQAYRGIWIDIGTSELQSFIRAIHGYDGLVNLRPCGGTGSAGPASNYLAHVYIPDFSAVEIALAGGDFNPNSGARVGIRILLDGVPVGADQILLVQNFPNAGNHGIKLIGSYDMISSRFMYPSFAGGTNELFPDIWRLDPTCTGEITFDYVLFNWTGPWMTTVQVQEAIQEAFWIRDNP